MLGTMLQGAMSLCTCKGVPRHAMGSLKMDTEYLRDVQAFDLGLIMGVKGGFSSSSSSSSMCNSPLTLRRRFGKSSAWGSKASDMPEQSSRSAPSWSAVISGMGAAEPGEGLALLEAAAAPKSAPADRPCAKDPPVALPKLTGLTAFSDIELSATPLGRKHVNLSPWSQISAECASELPPGSLERIRTMSFCICANSIFRALLSTAMACRIRSCKSCMVT
mmetsp:Transcript_42349/g.122511  ORF Transcript_42349/g.122511 Transcript_42349/m.122511 type:complete len:220 (-) Transcript_42349:106-765(-)